MSSPLLLTLLPPDLHIRLFQVLLQPLYCYTFGIS